MRKTIILIVLLSLTYLNSAAQQIPSEDSLTINNIGNYNYDSIKLPPLSVFIEAAKDYADIKYQDERIEEQRLALKISKKDWLKYIRLQGNYQYGTNNAYIVQTNEMLPITGAASTTNTQNWYNGGVVISIPLDDLFSRKNKNDMVRSRMRQIEYEASKILEERQMLILEAYNQVTKNLTLLKVRAEAVALYNAQMKISEKDFANGRIDIISLSLERARRATAMVEYQENRAALLNAVTVLEMLTKVKIMKQ